ncbi:MAG: hypothetical protein LBR95_03040 [Azoarcus sp.]|jgi:hypothetical protein|nr:hypothetical protein [Azoarcus sp.]
MLQPACEGDGRRQIRPLLGIHVDLLTPSDLPQKFRAKALTEARPVCENRLTDYIDHMRGAMGDDALMATTPFRTRCRGA